MTDFSDINLPILNIANSGGTWLLDDCACFQLRKAARAVTRLFDEMLETSGLRSTQFTILAAIDQAGSLTLGQLAEWLVMDVSTIARSLKPLERNGLVQMKTEGRRRKAITMTAKGIVTLTQALPLWRRAHEQLNQLVGIEKLAENSSNLKFLAASIVGLSATC